MKCLSLWQPWASLLAHGKKRVETRSWPISHRGPLLIHAAKHQSAEITAMCWQTPFWESLCDIFGLDARRPRTYPMGLSMPFGAIVGRVNVDDCLPTADVRFGGTADGSPAICQDGWFGSKRLLHTDATELAFGDYSEGRFAFLCSDFCAFAESIPYRGAQGLFEVPDSIIKAA